MSDFKYSLKAKEFSKRKYNIFPKKQNQIHSKQEPQQKISHHALQKKPLPYPKYQQFNSQSMQTIKDNQNKDNLIQGLGIIKGILIQNQKRILQINNKVNILYQDTIETYKKHQKYLNEVVQHKCQVFTNMMKIFLKNLQKKDQNLVNIDKRVTTFQNTLRSTYEILRTTKIKQDCIQVMIRNSNQMNQKTSILKQSNKKISQTFDHHFNFQRVKNFQPKLSMKQQQQWFNQSIITENIQKKQQQSSFLQFYKQIKPQHQEFSINQVSPFEANQFLLISTAKKPQQEYSFQYKQQDYPKIKRQIRNLKGQLFPVQALRDDLGYIRRKNGTYIFGDRGNVLLCQKKSFKKLCQEGIIKEI